MQLDFAVKDRSLQETLVGRDAVTLADLASQAQEAADFPVVAVLDVFFEFEGADAILEPSFFDLLELVQLFAAVGISLAAPGRATADDAHVLDVTYFGPAFEADATVAQDLGEVRADLEFLGLGQQPAGLDEVGGVGLQTKVWEELH